MSELPGIVVAGASGRMGQMLIKAIQESDKVSLAGVFERPGHAWIGQDLGVVSGGSALGIVVEDDPAQALAGARAVVDFTTPAATVALSTLAVDAGVAHIIGTTGMTAEEIQALEPAAKKIAVVRAGNMSLGVNLLMQITKQVAAALDEDFDIEVIEGHHHHKVDAPSGTALMLGEAAAEGRGISLEAARDSGRDGITGARRRGDIGFTAIRGGDIVGEHDVLFAGQGERIVLRHMATDRILFARGAVKAATWAISQPPGAYDMLDVLGMK